MAICEQGTFGGTCLNVGCIPTKMFVYAAEVAADHQARARDSASTRTSTGCGGPTSSTACSAASTPSRRAARRTGAACANVTVFGSHAKFGPTQPDGSYTLRTEAGDEFTADQVVIAAGSRINIPPAILDCGVAFETSDTIMRIPELPEHMVIVGGGFVAAEFAHVFSALGVRVTIVVRGHGLLTHCDDTICHTFTDIAARKWDLRTAGERRRIPPRRSVHRPGTRRRQDARAPTCCWWPRVAYPTATSSTPTSPASRSTRTAWWSSTSTNAPRRVGSSLSATSRRPISSSTSPTTRARVVQHNLLVDWDDTAAMAATDHRFVPSAVFTDPQIAVGRAHRRGGACRRLRRRGQGPEATATPPTAGRWRTSTASPS